jgi:DNA polymerase-3 subunit delta
MSMDLEGDIARGEIAPVYVLTGSERLLVDRVVGALTAALVTPATRAFNLDVLEAKAAGAQAILNATRTMPMMGKRRLVIVRDAETLGAEGLSTLAPYLDDPSPAAVLVLLCGKVDGRWKFMAQAKKKGLIHDLAPPRQLAPWIAAEAKRRGANLAPDGARRLADVVGADLSRLASAVDQLALFVGDGKSIGAADVDALIADTSEQNVFQLSEAVGQGDRERALRAVAKLVDQRESAVGVAMMLARHFRQLALYQELNTARAPQGEMIRVLGVPPFVLDKLAPQARRFAPATFPRAFALLSQADRDLKSNVKAAVGERIVLERLVGALAGLAVAK